MKKLFFLFLLLALSPLKTFSILEFQFIPGDAPNSMQILAGEFYYSSEEIERSEKTYLKDKSTNVAKILWQQNIFETAMKLMRETVSKMRPREFVKLLLKALQKGALILLRECMESLCKLHREQTEYRIKFEREEITKIKDASTITFFGPQYLFQTLRILWFLQKQETSIEHVHLIDLGYKDILECLTRLFKKKRIKTNQNYSLDDLRKFIERDLQEEPNIPFNLIGEKTKKMLLTLAIWGQFINWFKRDRILFYFYPDVDTHLDTEQKSDVIVGVDFIEPLYPLNRKKNEKNKKQNKKALEDFKLLCKYGLAECGFIAQLWYDYEHEELFSSVKQPYSYSNIWDNAPFPYTALPESDGKFNFKETLSYVIDAFTGFKI